MQNGNVIAIAEEICSVPFRSSLCVERAKATLLTLELSQRSKRTFNEERYHVISIANIYRALLAKHAKGGSIPIFNLVEGSKIYRNFQNVLIKCKANNWIVGEYLSAQFILSNGRWPSPMHLNSERSEKKYLRLRAIFSKQKISDSVAKDEQQLIERVTQATIRNLIVVMLARGVATLTDSDFDLVDRYTGAYLATLNAIPDKYIFADTAQELDMFNFFSHRKELIARLCKQAATISIDKLNGHNNEFSKKVLELKIQVKLVVASLYGL